MPACCCPHLSVACADGVLWITLQHDFAVLKSIRCKFLYAELHFYLEPANVELFPFATITCRQMGSAKFGSFLFLAAALTKTAELALSVQFPYFRPPLGPLAVLSTCSTTYYGEYGSREVTAVTRMSMRG